MLSVPIHPDWTGGLPVASYIDRVRTLGIHAVEVQIPPTLQASDLPRWNSLIEVLLDQQMQLALHLPLPTNHPDWLVICRWIEQLARSVAVTLVLHSATASHADPQLFEQTVAHMQRLHAALPNTATLAIEQGWNWGVTRSLGSRWQRFRDRQQQHSLHAQRPTGVGSGMGAAPTPSQPSKDQIDDQPDQPVRRSWRQQLRRDAGFCGTATRAATVEVVDQIDQGSCVIAWDLAHDWLGATYAGVNDWTTIPSSTFMRRVGYVRVHDVDEYGCDHQPLVMGYVPYVTQLRALARTPFAGTVCVAVQYTKQAQRFGSRWHLLEQSLAVTRQALRLPVHH